MVEALKKLDKKFLIIAGCIILIPIFIHILNNLIGTILTDFGHIEPIAASAPISYIMLIISIIAGILMIKYIRDNFNVLKS